LHHPSASAAEENLMLDVLVADDDDDVRESIAQVLEDFGHRVSRARDGREAERLIDRHVFDVAICDIHMPHVTGVALARRLRVHAPSTAVVVMTSRGSVVDVMEIMRGGVAELLTKPFEPAFLAQRVLGPIDERRALARELTEEVARRRALPAGTNVIAVCPAMRALVSRLLVLAQDDAPLFLVGESGTGKKTLATMIHEEGPRRGAPLVVVPCASLAAVILDCELRALASGAISSRRDSWFREAEGGTLVLDGVEKLPGNARTSLIRVLTEPLAPPRNEAMRPRGVRVIATASEEGALRVRTGECAEPLFFRLAGLVAHVPPLRERPGELLPLVAELLARMTPDGKPPAIEPGAWSILRAYDFPGNVAELACALQWACLMAGSAPIQARDLPPRLASAPVSGGGPVEPGMAAPVRRSG
jgi:DNA-binding NtrC family response regulator